MSLPSWLAKRLGEAVIVLIGLSIVLFCITRILPGDPARIALGPRVDEAAIQALRKQMNLDKPLITQYFLWMKGLLTGDLGISLLSRRPVVTDIKEYFPSTLEMIILAVIVQFVGGLGLGLLSAKYVDTWLDGIVRIFAYLGIATPAFVWGILLILIFGYWLPTLPISGRLTEGLVPPAHITGMYTWDSLLHGQLGLFWDSLKHLILPGFALAMGVMAQAARIFRSSIVDDMEADHVYAMRAYGVPENRILTKYLGRLALIPAISVMSLDAGSQFANAFIVESVFNFPGLSRLGMQAILNKDLNAMGGILMLIGGIFVLIIILSDVIVAYLDPRTRLQQSG